MKELKISVLMPVYNGATVIEATLQTLFQQNYTNFEIIISDDCSTDNVRSVLDKVANPHIKYFRNQKNVGYGANLELCRQRASADADIIFLMAQDDLLCAGNFQKINQVFSNYPDVGVIIRPFYLFAQDITVPIRDFPPYNANQDTVVSIFDGEKVLRSLFGTVVQLSGLAFRKQFITIPFHSDTMPAHTYPFFHIMRTHKAMCLKDYTVAVRRYTSQTRHVAAIYHVSPAQSWVTMVKTVFFGTKFATVQKQALRIVGQNFVGLVQLKNFSTARILWREYWVMIKNYPLNLVSPGFWIFAAGTALIPRFLLLPLVDWYQERVASAVLREKKITFRQA